MKISVSIGPTSIVGWGASLGGYISAILGSHQSAEWKAILASAILVATNAGRHAQAIKQS